MENLPKLVVDRLSQITASPESHPDSNVLNAFAERRLLENEREPLLRHLSLCADCREILALALPESELHMPSLVSAKPAFGWFTLPVWRNGLVAAGVLLLATAGIQYRRQERQFAASHAPVSFNDAASTATATEAEIQRPAQTSQVAALPPHSSSTTHRRPALRTSESVMAKNDLPAIAAGGNSQDIGKAAIVKAKDPVQAQPGASPAIASPAPPLQTSPTMMLRALPRWAVTANGALQRSFDGGKKWETIVPNSSALGEKESSSPSNPSHPLFRAVFASGLEVWAGGAAGALYHTADGGNHWTRIHPVDGGLSLTSDILSIAFSDPQHGTLSAANAELWTTVDGGQSWQKRQ
jgi:hypothetical protein